MEWQQYNLPVVMFFAIMLIYPATVGYYTCDPTVCQSFKIQLYESVAWVFLMTFAIWLMRKIVFVIQCYDSYQSRPHDTKTLKVLEREPYGYVVIERTIGNRFFKQKWMDM
jgi:hypothetical protein